MKYKMKIGDIEVEFTEEEIPKVNEMIRKFNEKQTTISKLFSTFEALFK